MPHSKMATTKYTKMVVAIWLWLEAQLTLVYLLHAMELLLKRGSIIIKQTDVTIVVMLAILRRTHAVLRGGFLFPFNYGDLFGGEVVEFVNQLVDFGFEFRHIHFRVFLLHRQDRCDPFFDFLLLCGRRGGDGYF